MSTETSETIPLISKHENRADPLDIDPTEQISIELTAADQYGIVNVFLKNKDVNFQVKEIKIGSKNAKEIIFTISEQNGEELVIQKETIPDPSVENNVVANLKDMVASELVIKFIPATCNYENKPLDICLKALTVCTEKVLQKPKDLSNPGNCSETRESFSNSPPTAVTSEPTSSNPSQEENMKTFPVKKIAATSGKSENFKIVCTLTKPNGEKLKQETSKKKRNAVHTSFAGEIASRVEIQFLKFPSDKEKTVSSNVFKISFQEDPQVLDIGGVVFVTLGIIFLIFVIAVMANHRLKWLKNYCGNELMVIICFLISNVFGILGFSSLIYLRCKISSVRIYTTEFTFSKLKLILLYIFGIGYMFHSGLYAWKHNGFQEDCPGNSCLNLIYDVLSIVYSIVIFAYFALFYDRKLEKAVKNYYVLTFIHVANVCVWLNAILFGSDFLYENLTNINNTSNSDITVTESNLAVEAIEKADVFCLPAMVEFSLMSIDMLFTDNDYTTDAFSTRNVQLIDESENKEKINHFVVKFVQIVVSLAAIVFFAFVFTVVLTTSSSNNILHLFHHFLVYFCFELGIKSVMVLLIFIYTILHVKWNNNSGCVLVRLYRLIKDWVYNFVSALRNPSSWVLIITTFGNIVYHIIYCTALNSGYIDIPSVSYIISLLANIVSLLLAPLQMLMILAIRSKDLMCTPQVNKQLKYLHSPYMHYTCFILGVFNLALWASDSIGEDRRSVLSIVYHWSNKELGSSVLYTIVFPITVFFRFQTGTDFLEFYWENVFNAR